MSPGPYTPQEYLAPCASLNRLVKDIRHKLYTGPINEGTRLSLTGVADALTSLRHWLAEIPQHLNFTVAAPLSHRRAIILLHLRYWSAVVLVTRPFLICMLLRREELENSGKMKHFDELSKKCIAAAEQSLVLLEDMANNRLLSSLVMFDFYFTLDLLQIFVIASSVQEPNQHQNHARSCFGILQTLSSFGQPKRLIPECDFQLQKLGLATRNLAVCPTTEHLDIFSGSIHGLFVDTYDMYVRPNSENPLFTL